MQKGKIIKKCKKLLSAYEKGYLGYMIMPEDSKPKNFLSEEEKLSYFTLPMALNYQRNSYTLWENVLQTYYDLEFRDIFSVKNSFLLGKDKLKEKLLKYKIALQPNKHIDSWLRISKTIYKNWGTIKGLLEYCDYDFLKLQNIVQKEHKKGFPYLSGPKIFHYWSYILSQYCQINFKNSDYIEIAPDTHVKQSSVRLGIITIDEKDTIKSDELSKKWRNILKGSGIKPIDMHSPLWFWSRNNFLFCID